jgi:hypothetical protein
MDFHKNWSYAEVSNCKTACFNKRLGVRFDAPAVWAK